MFYIYFYFWNLIYFRWALVAVPPRPLFSYFAARGNNFLAAPVLFGYKAYTYLMTFFFCFQPISKKFKPKYPKCVYHQLNKFYCISSKTNTAIPKTIPKNVARGSCPSGPPLNTDLRPPPLFTSTVMCKHEHDQYVSDPNVLSLNNDSRTLLKNLKSVRKYISTCPTMMIAESFDRRTYQSIQISMKFSQRCVEVIFFSG